MAKLARSARGEVVDFDLIAIRQQLASAPPPVEVSARREYIDNKEAGRPIRDTILNPVNVSGSSDSFEEDFENPNLVED